MAIACEPGGAVYVAVDEQGSLGRTPGGGKILRCVDKDGDGKVDDVTVFAKMDHPARRRLSRRQGLGHAPADALSVFQDADGDGVSDKQEVLVTGLTPARSPTAAATTPPTASAWGIDGWLYIAVGDYGIKEAKGKDGTTIVQRGGGIVRVRPDGTDLEVFCTGLRNPFDLAIDPFMNLFTPRQHQRRRRLGHARQPADADPLYYGYTQLFANFTGRDHADAGHVRQRRRHRRACSCKTRAGRTSIATRCSRATGAAARSIGTN